MGVTLHFSGRVADEAALLRVLDEALSFAEARQWRVEEIAEPEATLLRVAEDESDCYYHGPTQGLVIFPHAECEPIRLEFDENFYVQDYTKTQFAGAAVHINVVKLLRTIEPLFASFTVEDESEYWESGDLSVLEGHLDTINSVIQDELRKNPAARSNVKTPNGRIIDLYS